MATFNSNDFTSAQSISLVNEIALVGIQDAPLLSMLTARGQVGKAQGRIQTWLEYALDTSNAAGKPEGQDPIPTVFSDRRELNNALEIFSKASKVTGTAQAIENGILSQEIQMRLKELKVAMNQKLISGTFNDGSNGQPRTMRGLENWVPAAGVVTNTAVTEQAIKDAVRVLYNNGTSTGDIVAILNADMKEAVDEIFVNRTSYTHNVDTPFGANTYGMKVDQLQTNYGTVNFLVDRSAGANAITFANADYLFVDYLRAPHYEPLAKTGDADGGAVFAEATLRVMSDLALSKLTIASGARTASK